MKICSKCKCEKDKFSKGQSECKDCNKAYRLENKEKIKAYNLDYYAKNKMRLNENSIKYNSENVESLKEYGKNYRSINRDVISVKAKVYRKNRYHKDVAFRLRAMASTIVSRSLKQNSFRKSGSSSMDFLPWSIEELKIHLEKLFEPWMNWSNWGRYEPSSWDEHKPSTWTWQIDHIVPQSKLPYSSVGDDNFKKCWSLENLRPLSSKTNILDGNRR